jgi:hypothetical protein
MISISNLVLHMQQKGVDYYELPTLSKLQGKMVGC